MKINSIKIKNIGPFREEALQFNTEYNKESNTQPITIITGVNGAGKSIVIDAIRAALSGDVIGRNIVCDVNDFYIEINVTCDGKEQTFATSTISNGEISSVNFMKFGRFLCYGYKLPEPVNPWVIDFWSSILPTDEFNIKNLSDIDHTKAFAGVMSGKKSNLQLINFICQADYLRSSEMPEEKELGEALYSNIKTIVNICLDNGEFKYVRRTGLTPIVEQNGHLLSLDKLSSGNIFLIEHLLSILCKLYSVSVLCGIHPSEIMQIPGLLLIDEIENHLHPKWQKKILGIIRELFPNVQIILTTHSPFIVSALRGVKVYTCQPQVGYSQIIDTTDLYDHLSVEEILVSNVFNVSPFNNDISTLMERRKQLLIDGEVDAAKAISRQLYEINPEYFAYLSVSNQ